MLLQYKHNIVIFVMLLVNYVQIESRYNYNYEKNKTSFYTYL